jgi:ferredoxin
VAGLFGAPDPKGNLATVLTWNIWWVLVIISVFFLGSAWCSVCPWSSLADWLVKRRLWRRPAGTSGLNLRPPRLLRRVWPALLLLVGLTWLELAWGATTSPMLTAVLALFMVVLAAVCLVLFERKALCRYICPVGRTIGFYSQLAPIELRPVDTDVCGRCTTLECYHGTDVVEPCPTHLTMGRFAQNTYCTSCGNCVISCPYQNVAWRLRSLASEARVGARPHWDEAWFMVTLWAITTFHGLSMRPYWADWVRGQALEESGHLVGSFTLGMGVAIGLLILCYVLFVALTRRLLASSVPFERWFSVLAFTTLPVAFSYHVAHNLSHLARETGGLGQVLADPLGLAAAAAKPTALSAGQMSLLIPEQLLFAFQSGMILIGFWLALQVLCRRGLGLLGAGAVSMDWRMLPVVLFVAAAAGVNLFLLTQVMVMRM